MRSCLKGAELARLRTAAVEEPEIAGSTSSRASHISAAIQEPAAHLSLCPKTLKLLVSAQRGQRAILETQRQIRLEQGSYNLDPSLCYLLTLPNGMGTTPWQVDSCALSPRLEEAGEGAASGNSDFAETLKRLSLTLLLLICAYMHAVHECVPSYM